MKNIDLPKARYVVAVSGGIDSIVMLDVLAKKPELQLIVAHFNHGIRKDARLDEGLVIKTAKKYSLPIEIGYGRLGPSASEAKARSARYKFLKSVRQKHDARAIVTAHHQDDLIETAFLNILRGTKRKGLSSFSLAKVLRPLKALAKTEIVSYAKKNQLSWREDRTNQDEKYLRNYLRRRILPNLTPEQRLKIVGNLEKITQTNNAIDEQLELLSRLVINAKKIDRRKFADLPVEIARELAVFWLRGHGVSQVPKNVIAKLVSFIKTGSSGSRLMVKNNQGLRLTTNFAIWG